MKEPAFVLIIRWVQLMLILTPRVAWGYDSKGHSEIEQAAYRLFMATRATADHPDGSTMQSLLQAKGILASDYPAPHSSYPDLSLERQFAQDRLIYHFMAANKDVLRAAEKGTKEEQQHQLLTATLPNCLRLLDLLIRETLKNQEGASQAGRGLYVLIHIITDSYAPEHTTREPATLDLITIKGWRLSRLHWPEAAREKDSGSLLRLLHTVKGTEDKSWEGPVPGQLSPLATAGARAIADLLVMLYEAKRHPAQVNSLITAYFIQHFRPVGAGLSEGAFTFPGEEVIPFAFGADYESQKAAVFDFDRFPRHAVLLTGGADKRFTKVPQTIGLEYELFNAPRYADNRQVLISRIPYAIGGSVNEVLASGASFSERVLLKGFLKASLTLPLITANLEPYAGLSVRPFNYATRCNFIAGADLSMNLGNDFMMSGVHTRIRLALGYEYDRAGFPATHLVALKLGLNTFQARVVYRRGVSGKSKKETETKENDGDH